MRLLHRVLGLIVLVVAAFAGLAPASAQESQSRFAFVVGNDGYEGAPLATAANDAALVADALKAARFDVTGARNLDQDTLRASYREFLAKVTAAGPGAVSVVYLSGYGLQFDGENYLVPPGAAIARDADVSLNAIRLSDLIRPLSGAPGRGRAVLLDLAYASPFDKQIQGLAPGLAIVEPEAGTIVAFNSAPGTWAAPGKEPYGPYAQALSEMLREPGLPIEEILVRVRTRAAELTRAAQVPWSAGKIEPALVLLERGADAPAPAVTSDQLAAERAKPVDKMPEATAYSAVIDRDTVKGYEDFVSTYPQSPYTKNVRGLLAARREARTWRRTFDINTQNAYWSYLKRYPRGPHAAEARRRLTRLQAALEPPPAFDPVAYDDPPPPPVEEAYFAGPDVAYYDPGVPPLVPSVFVAAPPPWYQPPPPPVFDDDSDFFLPEVVAAFTAPAWIAPPPYVAPPPIPFMVDAAARPPGWRPFVAIPVAVAAGLAAGKLSNHFLDNRRQNLGQQGRPQRPPFIPAISSLPKGANLPVGVRPGQTFVRPTAPVGQQPGRPGVGQPGPGAGHPNQPVGIGRPNNALPGLPAGQPGVRPGVVGQPAGTPMGQPGGRPGNALPGMQGAQPGVRPGVAGQPTTTPGGTPLTQQGARPGQPVGGQQQIQQQRQQQLQQQQQQRQQLQQQQQQQRMQQQQQRQQQMQQQQQQRQQQMQRQQQDRARQQQQMQQQRAQQQQMQQQRMQQQRQQQQMQQQRMQQQQRQQQMMQQRQQQQMQQQRMQQQRQQQQMMQQRQQQIMQQQRQQQMMQQRQQQQRQQQPRRCPPGVRC